MKRKRRHLTAGFKARIAAEALKGEKSIQQITGMPLLRGRTGRTSVSMAARLSWFNAAAWQPVLASRLRSG